MFALTSGMRSAEVTPLSPSSIDTPLHRSEAVVPSFQATGVLSRVTIRDGVRAEGSPLGFMKEPNVEHLHLILAPNQRRFIASDGVAYVMTVLGGGVIQYSPGTPETTIYRLEAGRAPERIFAAPDGTAAWFGTPVGLMTGP